MLDSNWDLINGQTAHEIELLNYTTQTNVIECLVRLLLYFHSAPNHQGCTTYPSEVYLCELHRAGTLFLLAKPGQYRDTEVYVAKGDQVIYSPPASIEVGSHMTEFFNTLNGLWATADPLLVASYALWRINWVHPFKNGNGRTARAFAYCCLCLKFGFMLPGSNTVIDLITSNREEYQSALAQADQAYAGGTTDLSAMRAFLERLLIVQLSSLLAAPPAITP